MSHSTPHKLQVIASIMAPVLAAIHQAEMEYPSPRSGTRKRAHVLGVASAAIDGAPFASEAERSAFRSQVSEIVEGFIFVLHGAGVLRMAPKPRPQQQAPQPSSTPAPSSPANPGA